MLVAQGVPVLTVFSLFVLPVLILAVAAAIYLRSGKKRP
jgi:hypothetical protein